MFDMVRWYADLLLDFGRARHPPISEQRNLVAAANLFELSLIAAIWLRATGTSTAWREAVFQGFTLVTQLGVPKGLHDWAGLAVAASEVAALIVLLAGISAAIAEITKGRADPATKLRTLKALREGGLIKADQYEHERAQLVFDTEHELFHLGMQRGISTEEYTKKKREILGL